MAFRLREMHADASGRFIVDKDSPGSLVCSFNPARDTFCTFFPGRFVHLIIMLIRVSLFANALTFIFYFSPGIRRYRTLIFIPNLAIVNAMACKIFRETKFAYSSAPMALSLSVPTETFTTLMNNNRPSPIRRSRKVGCALRGFSFMCCHSVDRKQHSTMNANEEGVIREAELDRARDNPRSTDERDNILSTIVRRPITAFLSPTSSSPSRSTVRIQTGNNDASGNVGFTERVKF
jgi:hypothetical protein